ncbi:MAG: PEGA domain-containing protein [Ignavibacteriales bacterium]|nr:PEGA domain-containing protein [Ignavibacteriales bacterium]
MRVPSVLVLAFIVLFAIVVLFVGCATIMKGSDQQVRINSTPASAKVMIKTTGGMTVFEGTTPAMTKISRKNEYTVTVSLEGHKDATVNIMKESIEGWFWGNLLCGGVIGIIVDASNGAMHHLSPDEISVTLTTAYLGGKQKALYAVFHATDREGQLRSLAVPLMPNGMQVAQQ